MSKRSLTLRILRSVEPLADVARYSEDLEVALALAVKAT